MVNFCTCLTNNDYTMADATGQGTTWAKLPHTLLTSDYTLQDAPLKALQLLLSLKLCHYMTGDARWHNEYIFLIEDSSFRHQNLVAALWRRWTFRAFYKDAEAKGGFPTQIRKQSTHRMRMINISSQASTSPMRRRHFQPTTQPSSWRVTLNICKNKGRAWMGGGTRYSAVRTPLVLHLPTGLPCRRYQGSLWKSID